MAFLTRIDPTRNINRFYVVQVMPTLFGDWSVMREWGRCGSAATQCAVRPRPPSSARSSAACGGVTSSQAGEAMARLRPATLRRPAALASEGDDGAARGCNPRHKEATTGRSRPASFRRPAALGAWGHGAAACCYPRHKEAKPRPLRRLFRQRVRRAGRQRFRCRGRLVAMRSVAGLHRVQLPGNRVRPAPLPERLLRGMR
jgi:WGR domain